MDIINVDPEIVYMEVEVGTTFEGCLGTNQTNIKVAPHYSSSML